MVAALPERAVGTPDPLKANRTGDARLESADGHAQSRTEKGENQVHVVRHDDVFVEFGEAELILQSHGLPTEALFIRPSRGPPDPEPFDRAQESRDPFVLPTLSMGRRPMK